MKSAKYRVITTQTAEEIDLFPRSQIFGIAFAKKLTIFTQALRKEMRMTEFAILQADEVERTDLL